MKLESMIQELPIIESKADIDKLFADKYSNEIDIDQREKGNKEQKTGKKIRIIGKYRQVNATKRPFTKLYIGIVDIVLQDGSYILLYPFGHPSGVRPADEIAQFENKRVVVVGKFVRHAGPYHKEAQGIVGPCMLTVESIVRLYPSKAILC